MNHSDADSHRRQMPWPVVVLAAIIAALVVIPFLIPSVTYGPRPRQQCLYNLKSIGLALRYYHEDHGRFPPAYVADEAGRPMHSWRVLLLPYLDLGWLYREYRFDEPWNGPNNRKLMDIPMHTYWCPSDRHTDLRHTNYAVVVGPETMFPGSRAASLDDLRDAPESTVLVVELKNSDIHWMEPRDLTLADIAPGLNPPDGTGVGAEHEGLHVCLADGRARMLPADVDADVLRAMLTRDGGEDVKDVFGTALRASAK